MHARRAIRCRIAPACPGMYNAYNVLAATAVATALGVQPRRSSSARWPTFKSAFGRIERVAVDGRTITLALVKNPVGFNEVLRMLTMATDGLSVPTMIVINDRHRRRPRRLVALGCRFRAAGRRCGAADHRRHPRHGHGQPAQVRRRDPTTASGRSDPIPARRWTSSSRAFPRAAAATSLPTYTAMLDLRANLAERGRRRAVLGAVAMSMTFTIGWLYPTKMNIYGDRGNVIALKRRAAWRGLCARGGRDQHRRPDPGRHRRLLLRRRPGRAAGRRLARSPWREGRGDQGRDRERRRRCWPSAAATSSSATSTARTRPTRCPASACSTSSALPVPSGSSATSWSRAQWRRSGRLREPLRPDPPRRRLSRPWARSRSARGNNGSDGTEGAIYRNAIGCYLHGSLLPKNPAVTDWLIEQSLRRRDPDFTLASLSDSVEQAARSTAIERAVATR